MNEHLFADRLELDYELLDQNLPKAAEPLDGKNPDESLSQRAASRHQGLSGARLQERRTPADVDRASKKRYRGKIGREDFYRYEARRLTSTYDLEIGLERALKRHPGVARFTLNYVEPKLRAELDGRIMASADLIKLNRTQAVNRNIQRFSG